MMCGTAEWWAYPIWQCDGTYVPKYLGTYLLLVELLATRVRVRVRVRVRTQSRQGRRAMSVGCDLSLQALQRLLTLIRRQKGRRIKALTLLRRSRGKWSKLCALNLLHLLLDLRRRVKAFILLPFYLLMSVNSRCSA